MNKTFLRIFILCVTSGVGYAMNHEDQSSVILKMLRDNRELEQQKLDQLEQSHQTSKLIKENRKKALCPNCYYQD